MKKEIINKIIELKKDGDFITTHQFINELSEFGEPYDIINNLIDKEIVERIVEEKLDICSFKTKKMERIIKLKKLSK